MSLEPAITLYDIKSPVLTPQAWSPNTWKARIVLNYKRIPYKTVWLSYLDIEPTLVKLGCAPTATKTLDPSKPHYTLPAIVDTSKGTPVILADSRAIAEYLDATYPDRPVFPNPGKGLQYAFEECFRSVMGQQIYSIMIPASWKILDAQSQVYFRQSRERLFGKKLEELSPEGPTREADWKAIQKSFDTLAAIIEKNGPGAEFVGGGSIPTRADFIIMSYLMWIKVVCQEEWEKRVKYWSDGRWERLLVNSQEWLMVH